MSVEEETDNLADRIAHEIAERKKELEPYVKEYNRLIEAGVALGMSRSALGREGVTPK